MKHKLTRRAALLAGATAAAARLNAAPEPAAVISLQPEYYHGWPTLARRQNGELLIAWSGGRETHVCPFGRVELMRSRDDGRTWSWPEVLMDTPIDDRDAGVLETPAGSLLVTTFTSLAYESVNKTGWPAERLERWQAVERRSTAEQRKALLGTWMLRSTDGGMTWSAPYRVPVNSPHGPVALSDGRLLYAGKQLWSPGTKVGVAESGDDGQSWRWLSDIPARSGDTVEQYHELHAVEASPRRIVAQIRNHNPKNAGETLQCESADGGRTWTEPHPIGVWGLPSHLLRLGDGRLLMTYGYRRAPFGNQARVSADGGGTWSEPHVVSADGASGDLGYPSTVELPGGRLLTVWYEALKGSPRAVLRKAGWRLT
jgi:sialidase-1